MNYYRVKPEYDQKQRIKNHQYRVKRKPDGIFVANELYTSGELDKFYIPIEEEYRMFEHVVIPKNKVYWMFGCRFAMDGWEEDTKTKPKRRNKTEKVMDDYDERCKKWSEILAKSK